LMAAKLKKLYGQIRYIGDPVIFNWRKQVNGTVHALRPRTKGIHAEAVTITAAMAEKWLEKMVKNRPLSESKYVEYAIAMDEGKWSENAETIKFNGDGELIDGQHRLKACILANKSFRSLVAYNVTDEHAFATIDVGKVRPHSDIFAIAGYPDSANCSSAAMLVYQYKNEHFSAKGGVARRYTKNSKEFMKKLEALPTKAGVSKEELLRFSEPYKDRIIGAVRFASSLKTNKMLSRALAAGCFILFSEKSEVDAKRFFTDLCEGVGLSGSDPVYWLRERLISNMGGAHKLRRGAVLHLILKAWNKRRAGEKTKTLKLIEGEEFPKIK
jgi:hypothetical protein